MFMSAEGYLLSSGCFVGVKHPSAEMYSSSAPFAGSSLKPAIKSGFYKVGSLSQNVIEYK